MEIVEFTDKNGDRYLLGDNGDTLFPPFEKDISKLATFEARPDDIVLLGYPKSGCHWMWEVLGMVANQTAEYTSATKDVTMLELTENDVIEKQPSPRILNTHVPLKYIPPQLLTKKCKMVYLLRNPKDIAASLYNHMYNLQGLYHYSGSWSGFLPEYISGKVEYGSWVDYVTQWEKDLINNPDLPILVVHYEDMKQDLERIILETSAFLNEDINDQMILDICDRCQFKKMKQEKAKMDDDLEKDAWRDRKPLMYRKGDVGDWKNWFTVAENELYDKELSEKMVESNLSIKYQL